MLLDYNPSLGCPFIHQARRGLREAGSIFLRLLRLRLVLSPSQKQKQIAGQKFSPSCTNFGKE